MTRTFGRCLVEGCPNPHPARPFIDRERDALPPLARRIATLAPAPDGRPAWLRRDNAKVLDHGGVRG